MEATEGGEPVLLRVGEAAAMLRIGRTTLYDLLKSGQMPLVHIGKSARIPARAVRDFADRLEAEQTGGRP